MIPANTYSGQTSDTPTVAIRNILVTHEGVDADAVYQMVKAMFGNMDALVAAHAAAKGIKLESAASGLPLPFASGCRALLQRKPAYSSKDGSSAGSSWAGRPGFFPWRA